MGTTKPKDALPPVLESETGPVPVEAKCRVVVTPEERGLHVQTFTMVRTNRGEWNKIPMADAGFISWDVIEEARVAVATGVLDEATITRPEGRVDPATLSAEFGGLGASMPAARVICTCGSTAPVPGFHQIEHRVGGELTSQRDCPVHSIDPDDIPF